MIVKSFEERFWNKVEKTDSCWLWKGGKTDSGYGRMDLSKEGDYDRSHRISWKLTQGAIPKGMFVCHKCDVRLCVNPDHLFIGTQKDNMRDMITKGRQRKNFRPHTTVLTPEQVTEIRNRLSRSTALGINKQLAKEFGVARNTISTIKHNKSWKTVGAQ